MDTLLVADLHPLHPGEATGPTPSPSVRSLEVREVKLKWAVRGTSRVGTSASVLVLGTNISIS